MVATALRKLTAWLISPFLRWCERSQIEYLTDQYNAARETIVLKDIEIKCRTEEMVHMAAIIARDQMRVLAETAEFRRKKGEEPKGA